MNINLVTYNDEDLLEMASKGTEPEELAWLASSHVDDVAYAVIANPNVDLRTLRAFAEKEQHPRTQYSNYDYDGVAESAEARTVELFGEDWEQYDY